MCCATKNVLYINACVPLKADLQALLSFLQFCPQSTHPCIQQGHSAATGLPAPLQSAMTNKCFIENVFIIGGPYCTTSIVTLSLSSLEKYCWKIVTAKQSKKHMMILQWPQLMNGLRLYEGSISIYNIYIYISIRNTFEGMATNGSQKTAHALTLMPTLIS